MVIRLLCISVFFVGCSSVSVCPTFPKPSQEVLTTLKELNNQEVDRWVEDLFKLNKKLKFANGEK